MYVNRYTSDIYLHNQHLFVSYGDIKLLGLILVLLAATSSSEAVFLTGSSEYAVPGTEFTLTCDVPEEAHFVTFYRRPDVTTSVGSVQVGGDQCYNTKASPAVPCTADVCSCVVTSGGLGTVFRWIIQPQTGDHGSVWYCRRNNLNLPTGNQEVDSADYTLIVADSPGTSIALSPPDTTYIRTEGDTLPDITCTADCRPGCTFVWTRPDNTNFTVSAVLSLGQLHRSEHGTYRCTARNVVGESTIITSVTVQYGPGTSITLSPPDTAYSRTEGDTLPDIICTADCRPGCTFVWTRPGNTNFTVSPVLSLGQLDRSEHGTYRCTSRNVVGKSTIIISVTVQYGPGTTISLSPPNTAYTRNEGDNVQDVTCAADCRPGCTFVWTRPDNTNFTISPVLSLEQLDRSEHGMYRCTARNVVGVSTIITSVTVLCEPRPYVIQDEIQTINLATTENLTIPALFTSNPASSFIWTFQFFDSTTSTQLVNGKNNVFIQNTFETRNLTAVSIMTRTNILQDWFGLYYVTATNTRGNATLSFTVREKRNPGLPNYVLVGCTNANSADVSWTDGGDSQYYQVMFSNDRFRNAQEVYPVAITKHTDGSDVYSLNIDNLDGGRVYFFKVVAYNAYGNATSDDAVGCTVQKPLVPGTDSMFVAGIVLAVIGVVMLLLAVGLGIFLRRNGRLPFVKGRQKQKEFQNIQSSNRGGTSDKDNKRSQPGQFDMDDIAKASTYSEIGGSHQVAEYQNNPANGGDDGKYETLEGRSNPNVYDELQSTASCGRGTYANIVTGDD